MLKKLMLLTLLSVLGSLLPLACAVSGGNSPTPNPTPPSPTPPDPNPTPKKPSDFDLSQQIQNITVLPGVFRLNQQTVFVSNQKISYELPKGSNEIKFSLVKEEIDKLKNIMGYDSLHLKGLDFYIIEASEKDSHKTKWLTNTSQNLENITDENPVIIDISSLDQSKTYILHVSSLTANRKKGIHIPIILSFSR